MGRVLSGACVALFILTGCLTVAAPVPAAPSAAGVPAGRNAAPPGGGGPQTRLIDARDTAPPSTAPRVQEPAASAESRVEALVKALTLYLARFVEAASAVVIGIASIRALWGYLVDVVRGQAKAVPKEEIRLSLGRTLALALEFQLGADILKTAVAPTWNDVELLGAIAAIRTALNYFLEKELRNAETRDPAAGQAPITGSRTAPAAPAGAGDGSRAVEKPDRT